MLGLSAFYHDSAAVLLRNGIIHAAAQEERFTRRKHDHSFPENAIRYCLDEAGIDLPAVATVVFYEKPKLKLARVAQSVVAFAPNSENLARSLLNVWRTTRGSFRNVIVDALTAISDKRFDPSRLRFAEHHLSHAASAYYPSPFSDAVILTIDGVGEYATTTLGIGHGNSIRLLREIRFPHSLGLLYSAFTDYLGFKVNSGEYKVMGLAPYGNPVYVSRILDTLIDVKPDGSFWINMDYFGYGGGSRSINPEFERLMGGPARTPESGFTARHLDIAASVQKVLEEIVLKMASNAAAITGKDTLCLAGGVALNCAANGRLRRSGIFKNIWVQPAAGDAGGALGAAYLGHFAYDQDPRSNDRYTDAMSGCYLGPCFSSPEIRSTLDSSGANYEYLPDDVLLPTVARAIASGEIVGWFSGRMEFGPRALGARSILADARLPEMHSILNQRIKKRESFRPFAPAVLEEDARDWFLLAEPSPYMLFLDSLLDARRKPDNRDHPANGFDRLGIVRSEVPAITHVDYSARVQTVSPHTAPRLHSLIREYKKLTGIGLVVNTSFNMRGEPIVCSPDDALRCFISAGLDLLVMDNFLVRRKDQHQLDMAVSAEPASLD